jgi:hypothetical protein
VYPNHQPHIKLRRSHGKIERRRVVYRSEREEVVGILEDEDPFMVV